MVDTDQTSAADTDFHHRHPPPPAALSLAYALHPRTGALQPPPVRIVDESSQGRGNALIAARPIAKGSVIYTERACCCTTVVGTDEPCPQACHTCFRSLEPIPSSDWPLSYLWPSIRVSAQTKTQRYAIDGNHRFLQCPHCPAVFCSIACWKQANPSADATTCCQVNAAINAVVRLYEDQQQQPQAAVLLATRMLARLLVHHRTNSATKDDNLQADTVFEGICGDASETQQLELGLHQRNQESENEENGPEDTLAYSFRLEPIYDVIIRTLGVGQQQQYFQLFCQCAAQAARNGFAFRTRSPFDTYYSGILRVAGRGSPVHEQLKTTVAQYLVQDDDDKGEEVSKDEDADTPPPAVLQRGMEQQLQHRFTPDLCALFALTARINHSCNNNAQVQAQTFVDATMDLVATQDIRVGDEITISYLPPTLRRTAVRQKQLQARYLFQCTCTLCRGSGGGAV